MTDEQQRYLWNLYVQSRESGGPSRDSLPYSMHFEAIWAQFNARFDLELTRNEVWRALRDLDKTPTRRQALKIKG
jgi:hypothetical protein